MKPYLIKNCKILMERTHSCPSVILSWRNYKHCKIISLCKEKICFFTIFINRFFLCKQIKKKKKKMKQCSVTDIQQIQKIKYHLWLWNSCAPSTRNIKKTKLLIKKHLHCTCKALKNTAWLFDCKTVMELCNKISQPSVKKIIIKNQLF